jgi:hypothetical protein
MAPEKSEQESEQSASEIPQVAPADDREVIRADAIFSFDDRLLFLERRDREARRSLIQFQDVLVDQIVAVSVLEFVFAILLAMNLWTQFKRTVET